MGVVNNQMGRHEDIKKKNGNLDDGSRNERWPRKRSYVRNRDLFIPDTNGAIILNESSSRSATRATSNYYLQGGNRDRR
jgi:hypothetical protein